MADPESPDREALVLAALIAHQWLPMRSHCLCGWAWTPQTARAKHGWEQHQADAVLAALAEAAPPTAAQVRERLLAWDRYGADGGLTAPPVERWEPPSAWLPLHWVSAVSLMARLVDADPSTPQPGLRLVALPETTCTMHDTCPTPGRCRNGCADEPQVDADGRPIAVALPETEQPR